MAKRKHPSRKKTSASLKKGKKRASQGRFLHHLLTGIAIFAVIAILMGLAGWIGFEAGKEYTAKQYEKSLTHYRSDLERLRERLKPLAAKSAAGAKKREQDLSEISDYAAAGGETSTAGVPLKKEVVLKRPKLAIIIDDVAFASQLKAIRALPWKITPSLFPPTPRHPDTPKLAEPLRHYMIHLPMEALNYNHAEDGTLTTESSESQIDLRLRKLRHWFPNAHFINNHTGSRFTADAESMARFYPLAKRYGFTFIDSRTTPETVVPKIAKLNEDPYIGRDIFLDNRPEIPYIQNQLKKAVRIAKAHGYAIAIGHPHPTTLEALGKSGKILKGVDVVYMDELYTKIR
ncbi:divergent polysaccharide deacetylase family protein [Hydrogenimonas sp.]